MVPTDSDYISLGSFLHIERPARVQTARSSNTSPARHLLKPLHQPLPLQPRQPLDPEHPVELIDLVLVADGAQAVRLLGVPIAVQIPIADPHAGVALDLVADPRHRD